MCGAELDAVTEIDLPKATGGDGVTNNPFNLRCPPGQRAASPSIEGVLPENPAQLVIIKEALPSGIAGLPETDVAPVGDVALGYRLDGPVFHTDHLGNGSVGQVTPLNAANSTWKTELNDMTANWRHDLVSLPLLEWRLWPRRG